MGTTVVIHKASVSKADYPNYPPHWIRRHGTDLRWLGSGPYSDEQGRVWLAMADHRVIS